MTVTPKHLSVRLACVAATLMLVGAAPVVGHAAASDRSFAVRAGRVITMAPDGPWEIEQGIIIVRDGRIAAVGRDLTIPPDLKLIELPDAVIMPGLVAAAGGFNMVTRRTAFAARALKRRLSEAGRAS